jgi:hypothetical protein
MPTSRCGAHGASRDPSLPSMRQTCFFPEKPCQDCSQNQLIRCRKDLEPKDAQKLQQGDRITFDPSKLSLMEYGDVCKRLENPNYAKIYLGKLKSHSSWILTTLETLLSSLNLSHSDIIVSCSNWRIPWGHISQMSGKVAPVPVIATYFLPKSRPRSYMGEEKTI